ncbi:MAG: MCE family protein [Mycobacteriales bacterium]
MRRTLYPALGLVVLAAAAGSVWTTTAIYNKRFSDAVPVTVLVDRVGEQLEVAADVKVRGVRVGEVRSIEPTGSGRVALRVALDKASLDLIPAGVTARLLPKTLFGEKFVDLVPPAHPAGGSLKRDDVIAQDLSTHAVELQEVFDDLGPLLRAVQPADLNATLSSVSSALSGRGEQLGQTLTALGAYTGELNASLPDLQADVRLLADVTDRYGQAAPALLDVARNTTITARTLAEEQAVLGAVLRDTYGLSERTGSLLADNEERLVELSATLRPTLGLLAEFAPEYDCVFNGAKVAIKRIYDVFGGADGPFKIKGRLRIGQTRGVYQRGFEPNGEKQRKLVDDLKAFGPSCPVITTAPVGGTPNADVPAPARELIGRYRGPVGAPLPGLDTGAPPPPGAAGTGPLHIPVLGDPTGSSAERQAVEAAAAAALGRVSAPVNPLVDLLLGPMLRGMTVEENR